MPLSKYLQKRRKILNWKSVQRIFAVGVVILGLSVRKANAVDALPFGRPELHANRKLTKMYEAGQIFK